jgi:GDPmannose 4,6-dehydratase
METFDSIAAATLNILECIRYCGLPIRFLNTVSSECFGTTSSPASESTPFKPSSPYAIAKATSFWTVSAYRDAYRMHASSAILSNHESPLRPDRFVCRKIVAAAVRIANGSGETLYLGNTNVRRDWGLAAEYMEAIWTMANRDIPGDYVIATGATYSLTQFVDAVFRSLGLRASDHVRSDSGLLRPTDSIEIRLDPSKAHAQLGWKAQTKMEALAEILVACEQSHTVGPLPWEV